MTRIKLHIETVLVLRFAFILICLLLLSTTVFAQRSDLGSWNILNLKINYTNKLSFFGEGQLRSLRFYHHFHYYEYKGGINYKIHKTTLLTFGVGSYQTYREGGDFELPKNNAELRIWPQIILFQTINNLRLEQRYRAECRFTSNGYRNRYRYRLGISTSFGKEENGHKPFQANLSNEIFFTDREPYFERNRIQMTLGYNPSKNATIQLGYLHQFDYKINDETGRDFLVIGYSYELFTKNLEKQLTENEINNN